MDAIPKFLASAFVIIVAVFIGLSLIICGSSVVSARTFYSNTVDAISAVEPTREDAIIQECTILAEENGYTLKTEKVVADGGQYYYEVVLEYAFVAPFFGQPQTGTVSGYAYPGTHVNLSR